MERKNAKRRGAHIQPPNRFEKLHSIPDFEHQPADEDPDALRVVPTEFFDDETRSIVTENDSPDVGFRFSLNPYRGCEHGCTYCYARPGHEYLGLNAGLDFETKILVKRRAPSLLRDFLARDTWRCEPIMMSGVTDCYQPVERRLGITRQCLEVMLEARQPVMIITKNDLLLRDLDLLTELARRDLVIAHLSITTLRAELARQMEPRTSLPAERLSAVGKLATAGVPVRVMVAPIVPGLNDSEVPAILKAASDAGAASASYVLLRLPWSVRAVFLEWLERTYPEKKSRVEAAIRRTRGGELSDPNFRTRMRGIGEQADQIKNLFLLFKRKYRLDRELPPLDTSNFQPPVPTSGQRRLF